MAQTEHDALRDRAEREIALAEATGAKAHASPDFRTVFITRRDGSEEKVHIRAPDQGKPH
jgi:hypothetical protein